MSISNHNNDDGYNDQLNLEVGSNWTKTVSSFDDMNLSDELLRGIYGYGFEKPSSIQQRGIPAICEKRDVIAQAQSGTGKTATFAIAVLQKIDQKMNEPQAVVMAPTRELAQQIHKVFTSIGKHMNISTVCCIGGTSVHDDISGIHRGAQVIVATPGRMKDLVDVRRVVRMESIRIFVLDEADQMLSEGFMDHVRDLLEHTTDDMQSVLLSATMPQEVRDITKRFMKDPILILVNRDELTLEGIKQYYIETPQSYKFETLCDLYKSFSISSTVIFCNSRKSVEDLHRLLTAQNHAVSSIHGDMSLAERNHVMGEFRNAKTRVLATTDLLARGIDVQAVSLVINYDLPSNRESYLHRIGRSGRYGRKGVAINFVPPEDMLALTEIQTFYSTNIEPMPANITEVLN